MPTITLPVQSQMIDSNGTTYTVPGIIIVLMPSYMDINESTIQLTLDNKLYK